MTAEQGQVAPAETFAGWAELQIMGHVRHAGYVSEVSLFGASFVKIETISPETGEAGPTLYYGASSVYSLAPMPEEAIRAEIAKRREWATRRQQLLAPAPRAVVEEADEGDYYDGDDEGDEEQGRITGEDHEDNLAREDAGW